MNQNHSTANVPAGKRDRTLACLAGLVAEGRLRPLDHAFAAFVAARAGAGDDIDALVAMTAALAAHTEGLGNTCVELGDWTGIDFAGAPRIGGAGDETETGSDALLQLPSNAQAWAARLLTTAVVQCETAAPGTAPLVLSGTTLYLRRYWQYEADVAASIRERVLQPFEIDEKSCRRWLDRLFGGAASAQEPDWQRVACAVALRRRFAVVTGGPGTGKTYTVARLLALLFAMTPSGAEPRVMLAAPTGKAAARLSASVRKALAGLDVELRGNLRARELADRIGPATTLHKLLGARPDTSRLARDKANPLDVDIVVVDEASMIHLGMMAALLNALPANARLVLLGDRNQLASVEAGAVLGELCRDASATCYDPATREFIEKATGIALRAEMQGNPTAVHQQIVTLTKSRRYDGDIGEFALAINDVEGNGENAAKRAADAVDAWPRQPDAPAHWIADAGPPQAVELACRGRGDAPGYAVYLREMAQGVREGRHEDWVRSVLAGFERFRVLCALRESDWGVAGLNAAIERKLREEHGLRVEGEWYEGRPVLVTRNDAELAVSNGDVGVALLDAAGRTMRVYFSDGNTVRSVLCSRLAYVETAYAMTVHKSQGSEFEHVALVLPPETNPVVTRELVYTGVTRASLRLTLISANHAVFYEAIQRPTRRTSALSRRLRVSRDT
jgi:exodeoxyribonuclease V alpha subunit